VPPSLQIAILVVHLPARIPWRHLDMHSSGCKVFV
jgi:hypothetical protein